VCIPSMSFSRVSACVVVLEIVVGIDTLHRRRADGETAGTPTRVQALLHLVDGEPLLQRVPV
jgi:hypothetical protein